MVAGDPEVDQLGTPSAVTADIAGFQIAVNGGLADLHRIADSIEKPQPGICSRPRSQYSSNSLAIDVLHHGIRTAVRIVPASKKLAMLRMFPEQPENEVAAEPPHQILAVHAHAIDQLDGDLLLKR